MGPLVTRQHRDKVASYIDLAEADGAKIIVDGLQKVRPGAPVKPVPAVVATPAGGRANAR